MSDRQPAHPGSRDDSLAASVSGQVRGVLDAAQELAATIRDQARRDAEARLHEAEAEAARIVLAARREADDIVAERRRRITELSDALVSEADSALADLTEAAAARSRLHDLATALRERVDGLLGDRGGPSADNGASSDRDAASAPGRPSPQGAAGPRPLRPVEAGPASSAASAGEASPPPGGDRATAFPNDGVGLGLQRGARQVAAQMALAGSSRGEVAAHLTRSFEIEDPHLILNEVFGEST